ncbi:MAG: hypothetical protein ACRCZF_14270 [Gemmataceae bacterium]
MKARLCHDPEVKETDRTEYGLSLGRFGATCLICDQNQEAVTALTSAVEIFSQLMKQFPDDTRFPRHHQQSQKDLARAQERSLWIGRSPVPRSAGGS